MLETENPALSPELIPAEKEIPASPSNETPATPENDQNPASENSAQNSIGEKIRQAGNKVAGAFGIIRPGRGRPRKDGSPKKSDLVSENPAENPIPLAPLVAPAINPAHDALFARAIGSLVKGFFAFAKNIIRKKAKAAGISESFTDTALRECEVEPEVMQDFNDALKICLEKYNVSTQYAPEIALAVAASRMAGPYVLLLRTFDAEIERKKNEGK